MAFVHLDLFAGIGGFSLAAQQAGIDFEQSYFSEVNADAVKVYAKNFPGARWLGDITKIDGNELAKQHGKAQWIITGGFPCQDISTAGPATGITGSRSGLWEHYRRLIGELHPRLIVAENVHALTSRGLERVLFPLASMGYVSQWGCVRASTFGAVHRRERAFIVAYPDGERRHRVLPKRPADSGDVGDEWSADGAAARASARAEGQTALAEGRFRGEPLVGRVADGLPGALDRVRMLGNAVHVPTVRAIFEAIKTAGILSA